MKKLHLLYLAVLTVATCCMLPSCKSKYHDTNPTPDNYRMLGYQKVTTQTVIYPYYIATPTLTENYRFEYDAYNRVSSIYFTSNDQVKVLAGLSDLTMKFDYSTPGTIYKTITDVRTAAIKELDTFYQNPNGQITSAYFPGHYHSFNYYGKLLANENITYRSFNTTISAKVSYTSNNGDFLYRLFNNQLTATFPDSGIMTTFIPPVLDSDTVLSTPLTVTWTTWDATGTSTVATHNGVNGYSDGLSGYSQNLIRVDAIDQNGIKVRPCYFPAGYTNQLFFQIYDYLNDRPGDYLQVQSFTTYGVNIYENQHMVRGMTSSSANTGISYTIDANSKVTYTSASIKDSVTKNIIREDYKFQYETY
jgi:hypothetical protein